MDNSDVLQRNAAGELEVRVVNGTEKADAPANYDDVFTVNSEGKRALRVVGAGTVTSVNGVQPVDGNVEITGDNITATVGEEEATITQHLTTLQQSVNGKQDALTAEQLAAANSGITSAKVAGYDAYAGEISAKVNIAQGAENAGKVMTVGADGNLAPADAPSSSLPDQTGNAGKFLTTDGTSASWGSAGIDGTRFAYFGSVPEETANPLGAFCGCNIKTDALYPIQTYGFGTDINLLSQYCGAVGNDITMNGNISCVLGNVLNSITVQSDKTIVITNNGGGQTINEPNALVVGTNGSDFYKLLDGDTGLIPTERLATGGSTGDVLTRTATGVEWSSAPSSSAVTTDDTLTGTGTTDSPLGVAATVPAQTGTFVLKCIDGTLTWVAETTES